MKPLKITVATFFLSLAFSLPSHAGSTDTPDEPMSMQKGMGMKGPKSKEELERHLRMNQEQMLKMHDLSNRILSETDPKKKEQLKNEQLELMKTHHEQMMTKRMEKKQRHQKTMEKPAPKSTP
ncbi:MULTISPECIES: hypothetical protein [Methylomicrobium]|uniref:P pilus assembly/Cpx signaling pathway, periplasmic inhibitor/zinc-resistance associated protein n=1 Tax=Methylomicrobium album BG8 TaxID=686340 RepID=H8GIT8_METAL|nr:MULTISPECIES: hypothetical protein [Methylomicrobium]EIC30278.1 hypothetical protein Metal_2562 [Methylomicrobium album BG8]